MPRAHVVKTCEVKKTARLAQMQSMFDVAIMDRSREEWDVDLPLDEKPWNIGVIVGPSGCGKTCIARELWPKQIAREYKWSKSNSVIDDFPKSMTTSEVTRVLNSVGFSSPPSWVRPYHVLSNGEQFRVHVARSLAETTDDLIVMDEYSSVVDRTVAQIGSAAISKAIKRMKHKFIALSCHYDILDWLEPDWIYEPHKNEFQWVRLRRPKIELEICRVHYSAWELFKKHHYMSARIHRSARCYVALWNNIPVVFAAFMHFPHPHTKKPVWRVHRLVNLPDYQGVGMASVVFDIVGAMVKGLDARFITGTTHPGLIGGHLKSESWKLINRGLRKPMKGLRRPMKGLRRHKSKSSWTIAPWRAMWSFEYIGPAMPHDEAEKLWNG